ncbi:MAG TPA: gamma-glutamyl-gamma-aminobutyrate hydrolase family protein [Puia sp.]|nr:gamma-glutamyl-gamma-aminobutyrate hydrolase family protein [Puia sp.]
MNIGLTYTGYGEKHQNYVKWLKGNNAGITVTKLTAEGDRGLIKECDALVLSGGVDIHPEFYGGGLVYPKQPRGGWKKERDVFEREVFEFALGQGMPVLGVCRGLQLINVLLKGTLVQDLGEKGDAVHEWLEEDKRHPVEVVEGTLLHAIAGESGGEANSAHHQAIGRLGEGLAINCRAEDGTIEGIEWAEPVGKSFMIALQWHPERMYTNKLPDWRLYKNIRERFLVEAGNGGGIK